jgi:hypothetical protein
MKYSVIQIVCIVMQIIIIIAAAAAAAAAAGGGGGGEEECKIWCTTEGFCCGNLYKE